MANRFIEIDNNLCIKCNACDTGDKCDWFDVSSGRSQKTRPAFLYCIYCTGDCTQLCDQNAIMLVDVSGPHKILCRNQNINNFMEE